MMKLEYGFYEDGRDLVLEPLSVEAFNSHTLTYEGMLNWPEGFKNLNRVNRTTGKVYKDEAIERVVFHTNALYEKLRDKSGRGALNPDSRMKFMTYEEIDWAYIWLACLDTALIWECG